MMPDQMGGGMPGGMGGGPPPGATAPGGAPGGADNIDQMGNNVDPNTVMQYFTQVVQSLVGSGLSEEQAITQALQMVAQKFGPEAAQQLQLMASQAGPSQAGPAAPGPGNYGPAAPGTGGM